MQNLPASAPVGVISTVADLSSVSSDELAVPLMPEIAGEPPSGVADVSPGRPLAPILVADDDADDRFFIKRLLVKTGAKNPILTFDDGSEVVNYLGGVAASSAEVRARAPRLLFLDLRMNGLGGFGFLDWARQQKNALPLTIVVLSNSVEPADMAQAMALGAHRYLVKYPSVQTFSTIVRSIYPFKFAAP